MGYAVQSRQLMSRLHFAGIKVAYQNAYDLKDKPLDDHLLDKIVKRPLRRDVTQVALCQAGTFPRVKGRHTVGWTMLEVTGLPPEWVAGCNSMDEIWVPASFNVETFRNSGVTAPIRVMPLGVDVDYFHPEITGYRPSNRFTFLSVFEWGERKAPEVLLRAYAEEFEDSDDVLLLLSITNRDPDVNVEQQMAETPPAPQRSHRGDDEPELRRTPNGLPATGRPTASCCPAGVRGGGCRCWRPWPAGCR